MRESIPAKPEERPSPLAVVPTAGGVVAVGEEGERAASWWFEHANSLVTAWRREQCPDHGKAASLRANVELQSYLVYGVCCTRRSELLYEYLVNMLGIVVNIATKNNERFCPASFVYNPKIKRWAFSEPVRFLDRRWMPWRSCCEAVHESKAMRAS